MSHLLSKPEVGRRLSPEGTAFLGSARNHWGWVLAACWLCFFWTMSVRFLLVVLVPTMAASFGFSPGTGAVLVAVLLFADSVGSMVAGLLPWARRPAIIAGLVASAASNLLVAVVGSVEWLFLAAALSGLCGGLYLPRGLSLLTDRVPANRRGQLMSLHETATAAGMMVGPLFAAALLPSLSWRAIVVAWAPVAGLTILAVVLLVDSGAGRIAGPGRPLLSWRIATYMLVGGSLLAGATGLVAVLPVVLVGVGGWQPEDAAGFVGLVRVAGFAGILLAGPLGDRFGRLRILLCCTFLTAVGVLSLAAAGAGPLLGAATTIMIVASHAGIAVLWPLASETHASAIRVRALSTVIGLSRFIGNSALPAAIGLLLGSLSTQWIFGGVGLIVAVAFLTLWLSPAVRRET